MISLEWIFLKEIQSLSLNLVASVMKGHHFFPQSKAHILKFNATFYFKTCYHQVLPYVRNSKRFNAKAFAVMT